MAHFLLYVYSNLSFRNPSGNCSAAIGDEHTPTQRTPSLPRVRHHSNHHQCHHRIGALVSAAICRAPGIDVQRDGAILHPAFAIVAYPKQGHKHCASHSTRIFHCGCLLLLNTWHLTSGGSLRYVARHGRIRHSRSFAYRRNHRLGYQTLFLKSATTRLI